MRAKTALGNARAMCDHWRAEASTAREAAAHWERVAHRLRGELEGQRGESAARLADAQETIRGLVSTIGRYPDSLAEILNPRVAEGGHPVGMDTIGMDDALGATVGQFPEVELDPSMNGRASTLSFEDEERLP